MRQQVAKSGFNYSNGINFLEFKGFQSLTERVKVFILIIIHREMTLDHKSTVLAKYHFIKSKQNSTDWCPPDLPMNSPDKAEVQPWLILSHVLLFSLTVRFYPNTDNRQHTPKSRDRNRNKEWVGSESVQSPWTTMRWSKRWGSSLWVLRANNVCIVAKGYSISARMSSRRWESSMESSSLFSLNTLSWMSNSSVSLSSCAGRDVSIQMS